MKPNRLRSKGKISADVYERFRGGSGAADAAIGG
jgi:hypothetical protein